jgi:hypothetical protein
MCRRHYSLLSNAKIQSKKRREFRRKYLQMVQGIKKPVLVIAPCAGASKNSFRQATQVGNFLENPATIPPAMVKAIRLELPPSEKPGDKIGR